MAWAVVVKNFFSLFIGGISTQILQVLALAVTARTVGAAEYGRLALYLAIMGYCVLLSTLGLTWYGIQAVAADVRAARHLVANIAALRLTINVILTAVLCSFPVFKGERDMLLAFCGAAIADSLSPEWVFVAVQKHQWQAIVSAVRRLSFVIALLFCFYILGIRSAMAFGWSMTLSTIVASCFALARLRMMLPEAFECTINVSHWPQLLKCSAGLNVGAVLSKITLGLDVLILSRYYPATAVGAYSASTKVYTNLQVIGEYYNSSVLPAFASSARNSSTEFRKALGSSAYFALMATCLPAMIGLFYGKGLLTFVFGQEFAGGHAALRVFMLALPFLVVSRVIRQGMIADNMGKPFGRIAGAGTVVTVSAMAVCVPRFGGIGAAWCLVAAEGVMFALTLFEMRNMYVFEWKRFAPVLLLAAMACGLCAHSALPFWFSIAASVVLYGGALVLWDPELRSVVAPIVFGRRATWSKECL